jgi:hypothetical protein
VCPEVIIELGEDISRFRDASKELYNYLKAFSWNGKAERLGFDEVWHKVLADCRRVRGKLRVLTRQHRCGWTSRTW